jgi:hypothetical protein
MHDGLEVSGNSFILLESCFKGWNRKQNLFVLLLFVAFPFRVARICRSRMMRII